MAVYVSSLSATPDQVIQPLTDTLLLFPFDQDQMDQWGMHDPAQPDGITAASSSQRAGLIWPSCEGWGHLTAEFQWEAGGYTEIRDAFMRDPLGLTDDPRNDTAREDRYPTGGYQWFVKNHQLSVHPGVPLGVMVRHNDKAPRKILYAQFKLAIHPW
ncbi:hypothetical protein [Streptomyces bauhiniae]|uniref:Uncharacterized protein n=1 Tax=Streptomyces bauhiniae TaxID=2340725 RepID=A0A7K3QRC4_9ACTN|nr:hypothetical protein [Streptomyces bauhiniae]NEB92459.1 hypothetical protein [Streptomyces bauhiniae]